MLLLVQPTIGGPPNARDRQLTIYQMGSRSWYWSTTKLSIKCVSRQVGWIILPYIFAGVSWFTFALQSNRKSTNENSTWCSMHSAVCISVCLDMFGEWHVLAFTSGFFFQFCLLEQQKEHNREHHLVVNALEAMCLDKFGKWPFLAFTSGCFTFGELSMSPPPSQADPHKASTANILGAKICTCTG